MKISFHHTEIERIPNVRLSLNEDDLIERRYSIETLWNYVKSNKLKLLG